jgi:hypothetical protein
LRPAVLTARQGTCAVPACLTLTGRKLPYLPRSDASVIPPSVAPLRAFLALQQGLSDLYVRFPPLGLTFGDVAGDANRQTSVRVPHEAIAPLEGVAAGRGLSRDVDVRGLSTSAAWDNSRRPCE